MKRKQSLSSDMYSQYINQTGFSYIPGCELEALLGLESWGDFITHWETLSVDEFAMQHGVQRKRSYIKLLFKGKEKELQLYQDHEFFQDRDINHVFGGIKRNFSQPNDAFVTSQVLRNILLFDFESLPLSKKERNKDWFFGIHQISSYTHGRSAGIVTPEGIHTDGHLFSAQHFIRLSNIAQGGISRIYDSNKCLVNETFLNQPLDTILLHDQVMYHDVTPFYVADTEKKAFRNMLLIDFDPVISSEAA